MSTATRRRIPRIGLAVVSLLAVFGMGGGPAPEYEFRTIPPPDAGFVQPQGITNGGVVTGSYFDADFNSYGFLYSASGGFVPVTCPLPGAIGSTLFKANERGQVAAAYVTEPDFKYHGAIFDARRNAWTPLPDPDPFALFTFPGAINERGQVVGNWSADPMALNNRGFVYERGQFTPLDVPGVTPGGFGTVVQAVNSRGDVVGWYDDRDGIAHGFIRDGQTGRIATIDVPAGDTPVSTFANGINDQGTVVGSYSDGNARHGFLWRDGHFTTVDVPGEENTSLAAINNRGDITGYTSPNDGTLTFRAFIGYRRGR